MLLTPSTIGAIQQDPLRRTFKQASLDLRFAENKSLADAITGQNLVTFTRASAGTYVGSDGLVKTAAENVPRFDHNPVTGECLGLLVEEQRSNSIRNNTMVGAVAGTPGTLPTNWSSTTPANGITREIVGTGTENGIAYVDIKFSGTNTLGSNFYMDITFDSGTITAAQGQVWTKSLYAKVVAGAITGAGFVLVPRLILYELPNFVSSTTNITASSAPLVQQRFAHTRTLTDAATTGLSPRLSFIVATGGTIDFTLRIGMPQLEQGAFATSVIPTTDSAATRSADVASITGANFSSWYRQDEGSFLVIAAAPQPSGGNRRVLTASDGTGNNRVGILFNSSNNPQLLVASGGTLYASPSIGSVFATGLVAASAGYKTDDFGLSSNGSAVGSDTGGSVPSTVNVLDIGSQFGVDRINGTIRRLAYWPQRLSNATLQSITA